MISIIVFINIYIKFIDFETIKQLFQYILQLILKMNMPFLFIIYLNKDEFAIRKKKESKRK